MRLAARFQSQRLIDIVVRRYVRQGRNPELFKGCLYENNNFLYLNVSIVCVRDSLTSLFTEREESCKISFAS